MTQSSAAPSRTPMFELFLLGLLSLLWGASYALIKLSVETITPVTLVATRVLIAAGLLWLVVLIRRHPVPSDLKTWGHFAVQSMIGFAIPFTMITWGQQYVESGLAGILNSTTPIFVFLASITLFRSERVTGEQAFGAIAGLGGVCLLIGLEALRDIGSNVAGQFAITGATISYAAAMIYGKRFRDIAPETTAACTLSLAAVVLIPSALVFEAPLSLRPSTTSILALFCLAAFCTAGAFTLYFRLVNTLGAVGTSSVAYSRAAISVVIGVVFLGEAFGIASAVGMMAVLAGVAAINGQLFSTFSRPRKMA